MISVISSATFGIKDASSCRWLQVLLHHKVEKQNHAWTYMTFQISKQSQSCCIYQEFRFRFHICRTTPCHCPSVLFWLAIYSQICENKYRPTKLINDNPSLLHHIAPPPLMLIAKMHLFSMSFFAHAC
jgi:hypothetical protein